MKQNNINKEELIKLIEIQATEKEIASFFNVSIDTLKRYIKTNYKMSFKDFQDFYSQTLKIKLRKKLIDLALNGDKTILIFLAKNYLGLQNDPIPKPNEEDKIQIVFDLNTTSQK